MSLRELKGFKYPITIRNGRMVMSSGIDHLRENIARIILTRPGEVPFLNSWGCRIAGRTFDPVNARHFAESDIRRAVELYEPRAEVTDIEVITDRIDEGILDVRVEFRPKSQEATAEAYISLEA